MLFVNIALEFYSMSRIMGIDFGTKRVGIAVTDPLQIIATGLTTINTNDALPFIKQYIATEPVTCIVIGQPTNLDGTPTHATHPANLFAQALAKAFPDIKIVREEEHYTSKNAMRVLVQSGVKKKQRRNKALLDEVSAVLILQTYLGHI